MDGGAAVARLRLALRDVEVKVDSLEDAQNHFQGVKRAGRAEGHEGSRLDLGELEELCLRSLEKSEKTARAGGDGGGGAPGTSQHRHKELEVLLAAASALAKEKHQHLEEERLGCAQKDACLSILQQKVQKLHEGALESRENQRELKASIDRTEEWVEEAKTRSVEIKETLQGLRGANARLNDLVAMQAKLLRDLRRKLAAKEEEAQRLSASLDKSNQETARAAQLLQHSSEIEGLTKEKLAAALERNEKTLRSLELVKDLQLAIASVNKSTNSGVADKGTQSDDLCAPPSSAGELGDSRGSPLEDVHNLCESRQDEEEAEMDCDLEEGAEELSQQSRDVVGDQAALRDGKVQAAEEASPKRPSVVAPSTRSPTAETLDHAGSAPSASVRARPSRGASAPAYEEEPSEGENSPGYEEEAASGSHAREPVEPEGKSATPACERGPSEGKSDTPTCQKAPPRRKNGAPAGEIKEPSEGKLKSDAPVGEKEPSEDESDAPACEKEPPQSKSDAPAGELKEPSEDKSDAIAFEKEPTEDKSDTLAGEKRPPQSKNDAPAGEIDEPSEDKSDGPAFEKETSEGKIDPPAGKNEPLEGSGAPAGEKEPPQSKNDAPAGENEPSDDKSDAPGEREAAEGKGEAPPSGEEEPEGNNDAAACEEEPSQGKSDEAPCEVKEQPESMSVAPAGEKKPSEGESGTLAGESEALRGGGTACDFADVYGGGEDRAMSSQEADELLKQSLQEASRNSEVGGFGDARKSSQPCDDVEQPFVEETQSEKEQGAESMEKSKDAVEGGGTVGEGAAAPSEGCSECIEASSPVAASNDAPSTDAPPAPGHGQAEQMSDVGEIVDNAASGPDGDAPAAAAEHANGTHSTHAPDGSAECGAPASSEIARELDAPPSCKRHLSDGDDGQSDDAFGPNKKPKLLAGDHAT